MYQCYYFTPFVVREIVVMVDKYEILYVNRFQTVWTAISFTCKEFGVFLAGEEAR